MTTAAAAPAATMADKLVELLAQRHSCRGFLSSEVPQSTMRDIFDIAQRAASWCNTQPWMVEVASGTAAGRVRTALLGAVASGIPPSPDFPFPQAYRGVYQERRRECGFQLYEAVGVRRGDRAASAQQGLENFRLFGAPHVAVVTSTGDLGVYGAADVGGYVQVLMLAMQAHGVQSIAQAALAVHSATVKRELGIPAERRMVCAISFGYEDTKHPANNFRTSRAPIDEAVRFVDR